MIIGMESDMCDSSYDCDKPNEGAHSCPYSDEIGDGSVLCTCCSDCEYQCLMEV